MTRAAIAFISGPAKAHAHIKAEFPVERGFEIGKPFFAAESRRAGDEIKLALFLRSGNRLLQRFRCG
jgi:hypothetical protein